MDIMQIAILTLVITSTICILILSILLARVLFSTNKLLKSANAAADIINAELKPVVSDLKETISGVTSIVKAADNRIKVVNCAISGFLGATGVLGGKFKGLLSGVVEGFKAGLNLFKN